MIMLALFVFCLIVIAGVLIRKAWIEYSRFMAEANAQIDKTINNSAKRMAEVNAQIDKTINNSAKRMDTVELIAERFPEVSNFKIDVFSDNVEPIEYFDKNRNIIRHEYPPLVSWRIGDIRYKYVPKAHFKEYDVIVGSRLYSHVEFDYECDEIIQAVAKTVSQTKGE
jgi:hypothetical protein